MIKLCAPTDEAGSTFEEAVNVLVENGIHLVELRDLLDKNILQLTDDDISYCLGILQKNNMEV